MIEDKYINARFEQLENAIGRISANVEILKEVVEYLGEGDVNTMLKEARGEEAEVEEGDEDNQNNIEEENEDGEDPEPTGKRSRPKAIEE